MVERCTSSGSGLGAKALHVEKQTICSGVRPLAPGWPGSALFLPESSSCNRSRSPLMAAAESLLCCRLLSSPLKAGAVEGRTLSGSPLSRNLQEEVHAMRELAAAASGGGGYAMAGGEKNTDGIAATEIPSRLLSADSASLHE